MISYMYTFDYTDGNSTDALLNNLRVYTIADKYDIKELKELARKRFSTQVQTHWNHAKFPAVVREVYDSTVSSDHGLRDIIEKAIKEHVGSVLDDDNFKNLLISEMGELGVAVLQGVLNLMEKQRDQTESTLEQLKVAVEQKKAFEENIKAAIELNLGRLISITFCSGCNRSLIPSGRRFSICEGTPIMICKY